MTVVDKDRNCREPDPEQLHGLRLRHVPGDARLSRSRTAAACSRSTLHHANRLEPHKRPFHTIIPGFVTKDGKPWLSFGLMGGDMQAQGHVQVLCDMIDFGMDVQEAGDAPGSATSARPNPPDTAPRTEERSPSNRESAPKSAARSRRRGTGSSSPQAASAAIRRSGSISSEAY